jgi:septal ring factor EnvC (AmiA/AmiB activator)
VQVLDKIESRLKQLKAEYEAGKRELVDLERKEASVRDTLKRLRGAIGVLEEELKAANSKGSK